MLLCVLALVVKTSFTDALLLAKTPDAAQVFLIALQQGCPPGFSSLIFHFFHTFDQVPKVVPSASQCNTWLVVCLQNKPTPTANKKTDSWMDFLFKHYNKSVLTTCFFLSILSTQNSNHLLYPILPVTIHHEL